MNTLIESLQTFTLSPLIIGALCGVTCGILGPFFVWRNLSFMGDAVAHSALTPLSLALYLGISPMFFLLPFNLALALFLAFLAFKRPRHLDSYISILFAGFMGLGLLIAHFSGSGGESILEILFGDITQTSGINNLLTIFIAIAVLGHILFWRKQLFLTMLNPELAAVEGINVRLHEVWLLVLMSLTVTIGLKLMGTILLTSLIVTPAIVTRSFSQTLRSQVWGSSILGGVLAFSGIFLARIWDLPSSAVVATLCLSVFLISVLKD